MVRAQQNRKRRRTKDEIAYLKAMIYAYLAQNAPAGCRGVFYALVVQGHVHKTNADLRTVERLLKVMREDGMIPFDWVQDSHRYMLKPRTHNCLEEALRDTSEAYRRTLWGSSNVHLEIWLEKRGLSGVIYPMTASYDVPLMPAGGFASLSFLHASAADIVALRKPTFIYGLGDHDPSGRHIWRSIRETLQRYAERIADQQDAEPPELYFEQLALTAEQVEDWNLPTRVTKRRGNPHAKGFEGDSTELDAVPPEKLRELVEDAILKHVDHRQIEQLERIEACERKVLQTWIDRLKG